MLPEMVDTKAQWKKDNVYFWEIGGKLANKMTPKISYILMNRKGKCGTAIQRNVTWFLKGKIARAAVWH